MLLFVNGNSYLIKYEYYLYTSLNCSVVNLSRGSFMGVNYYAQQNVFDLMVLDS